MSDININGIPNMGFQGGGGGYFYNPAANLAQNQAALAQQQATAAQRQQQMQAEGQYFNNWSTSTNAHAKAITDAMIASNLSVGKAQAPGYYAGNRIVTPINTAGYSQQNLDVAAAGVDPTAHWFDYGLKEGRNAQTFNPYQYLQQNPDVWSAGADPYQHYNQYGITEGRTGAWSDYNPTDYLNLNPDVKASGMDPTAHWFQFGEKEGRQGAAGFPAPAPWLGVSNQPAQPQPQQQQLAGDWNSFFNTATAGGGGDYTGKDALAAEYYLANPDVFKAAQQAGGNHTDYALNHLMSFGDDEDRRFFDANAYLQQNPDVFAAGANPFQHYTQYGKAEGRAAPLSGTFDDRWYGLQNPDVLAAGMDPTAHWFEYGAKEGRAGGPAFNTSGYKDPWAAGIPQGRNSRDVLAAMLAASQSTGMSPNAMSALFGVESVWDPRANTKGNPNWGVPQLSEDMWGDAPFKGVINGKTWQQYRDGTAAEQIGVFADWLKRSGAMTRGGLDFAAQPEDMQFALLMANQLGGHYGMDWRNRIAGGDMTTPVYQGDRQAGELGNLSPQAFIKAYWDRVARWPTQQTNWGP
jgi:hypothetical protein